MKAIIIDDEPNSIEALKLKIQKLGSEIAIVDTFYSAIEAIDFLENNAIDIIFLDIEMPEMDGFEFLEQFPVRKFEVIITTAHNQYAINALRQSVLDFLLKPINISELTKAIDRFNLKQNAKKTAETSSDKLNALYDKLPVPSLRGLIFIAIKDILYMDSDGSYSTIHLENNEKVVSSRNLGEYETQLNSLNFMRIHNSYIINLIYIKEYVRGEGGTVILKNNTELPVSKRKKPHLLELIS